MNQAAPDPQTESHRLVVELVTEELPPKALARLGEAFATLLLQGLVSRDLIDADSTPGTGTDAASRAPHDVTRYATPRRLALSVAKVRAVAPSKRIREKLLPVSVGLDAQGQASAPLKKKLAALGFGDTPLDQLERAADAKGEAFFMNYTAPGVTLATGLQAALDEVWPKLPIPKVMNYQRPDGTPVQFVRPVHSLLALLGEVVVPVTALGLKAGRNTIGHRFLSQGPIEIPNADAYAQRLADSGRVLANFEARRESIRRQLLEAAGDDRVVMPDSLLDEVTGLTEWPVVYACSFEDVYLTVPQECLILTMQTNQKYFALTDAEGRLRSRFLVVSNLATDTPASIIEGNERVVRPRLADARFFFEQDQKKSLADRVPALANVVYHNKLGSQLQRTQRIASLAGTLAPRVGALAHYAERAALLAKADLLTDMVGEFPELQGTMGRYYALHDGEVAEVALSCAEHYLPRFAGDALPSAPTGTAVALADKLETLTGIWGIGLAPTGEKDPFALRRHALGILRIVLEKRLPLDLKEILREAHRQFASNSQVADNVDAIYAFLLERLRGLLRDSGYTANQIEAVLSSEPTRIDDLIARLEAVAAFAALPQAEALSAANKRISNILRKSADGIGSMHGVNRALLHEPAEAALNIELDELTPLVQAHMQAGRFTEALLELARLHLPVDAFFNDVMVNAEDTDLRTNRLRLLAHLHAQMNCVADLSKLAS
jgi:glycyl-tRNA synthetase beta chain